MLILLVQSPYFEDLCSGEIENTEGKVVWLQGVALCQQELLSLTTIENIGLNLDQTQQILDVTDVHRPMQWSESTRKEIKSQWHELLQWQTDIYKAISGVLYSSRKSSLLLPIWLTFYPHVALSKAFISVFQCKPLFLYFDFLIKELVTVTDKSLSFRI